MPRLLPARQEDTGNQIKNHITMNKSIKLRLIVMNIIQWAVWGSYLTSMGSYLASIGLATRIGIFYAMQGIVSIFMPTLMGIVADKFIPAQKLLGLCHGIAGAGMIGAGLYSRFASMQAIILSPRESISVSTTNLASTHWLMPFSPCSSSVTSVEPLE